MAHLEIRNISKSFPSRSQPGSEAVLRDISLSVADGRVLSLLGPSGIGKTTLLKIVCGLLPPDEGDVLLDGESILSVPVERRGAVLMFQEACLFPHMTVMENIAFGPRMRSASRAEQQRAAAEMLALVEMEEYSYKMPRELSGGQRQRVALARALAVRPRLLLLDEPFSSLDTRLRLSMRAFTLSLQKKTGVTTLLVTHDWEEALQDSDLIGLMLDGRLAQSGTPEDLFSNPASPEVANFFGIRNYFDVEVTGGKLVTPFGICSSSAPSGSYQGMLRPDQITLAADPEGKGIVSRAEYGGERIIYRVEYDGNELQVAAPSDVRLAPGGRVALHADPERIRLFTEEKRGK
jgi:iron(III) transport system ATP-binding protein